MLRGAPVALLGSLQVSTAAAAGSDGQAWRELTMAARLLSRSAFSTKPTLEGGTAGLVGGSVTPCTGNGQHGRVGPMDDGQRHAHQSSAVPLWGCPEACMPFPRGEQQFPKPCQLKASKAWPHLGRLDRGGCVGEVGAHHHGGAARRHHSAATRRASKVPQVRHCPKNSLIWAGQGRGRRRLVQARELGRSAHGEGSARPGMIYAAPAADKALLQGAAGRQGRHTCACE